MILNLVVFFRCNATHVYETWIQAHPNRQVQKSHILLVLSTSRIVQRDYIPVNKAAGGINVYSCDAARTFGFV